MRRFLEMAAVFHEFKYNFPIDVGPLLDASSPIYQEWIPYGLRRDYRHRMTTRQTNPAEGQYRKCSGCGEERLCLLRCSACDTHSLCSTECHRKHWPCLKMECKAARRAQAAAVTCNAAG